jgi:hypothetical protein
VIAYNQRIVDVGMNRSGKSEWMRYAFVELNVARVLVDPKGEWFIEGVPRIDLTATDLLGARAQVKAAIDLAQPLIHIKPGWKAKEQLEALFEAIGGRRGPQFVWIDECYGVSTSSWCPAGLHQLLVAGAGLGQGVGACTQRPVKVAPEFFTEADHVLIFPPLEKDDFREALQGVPFVTVDEATRLAGELPQHGYLWADRREKTIAIGPPLPAELRAYKRELVGKR